MNTKCWIITTIIALLIAICFLGLLLHERNVNAKVTDNIDNICERCLSGARDAFDNYLQSGSRQSYLSGVSNFHTFKSLYSESSLYDAKFVSVVSLACARLMFNDEMTQNDIELLLSALTMLADDYGDITGYTQLQIFVSSANSANY